MELASRDSVGRLRLSPVAYQFPDGDDSWLMIAGDVVAAGERWSFCDPALTAHELARLVSWLRAIADGTLAPAKSGGRVPVAYFLEPNLEFALLDRTAVDVTIRVQLGYESGPPSMFREERRPDGTVVVRKSGAERNLDLTVWAEDFRAAVDQLAAEAVLFPPRASEY